MDQNLLTMPTSPGCETARSLLLEVTASAEQRAKLTEALSHLHTCESCQVAMEDFDRIGQLLGAATEISDTDAMVDSAASQWVNRALAELPRKPQPRLRLIPFVRLSAAACMGLALGVGAYLAGRAHHPTINEPAPSPSVASIAPAELSDRVQAFQTLNKFYGDRAGWVLVSDNASEIGLEPEPSSDQGMLVVRLMVTRRNDPGNSLGEAGGIKSVVSSADLAILPGRTAKLSLPFSNDRVLSYEISIGTGSPTRLGVIAELHSANSSDRARPLAALSTSLDMQPSGTSRAGSFVTGNADYELTVGFSKAELAAPSREGLAP